jgi:pimeloyl-ACP methyl ester carboxylesterase
MHHFPNEPVVRSIILDSVDTLPEDVGTEYRTATHLLQKALFESVFETCAQDPSCDEAYPGLRTRLDTLANQLNQSPLVLDVYTTIDGDGIYQYLFPYNPAVQNIAFQPRLIVELEQGITTTLDMLRLGQIPEPATRTTFLPPAPPVFNDLLDLYLNCDDGSTSDQVGSMARLMDLWDAEPGSVAAFLNQACDPDTALAAIQITDQNPYIFNHIISRFVPDEVQGLTPGINRKLNCTEQYPFREDFSEIEANLQAAQLPNFYIENAISEMLSTAEGCEAWQDALTAPTSQTYGEYPVLVLQGQLDSLTSPAWAETAVSAIPQAKYVLVPNAWHSIMGNNGLCPTNITQQFLTNPDADIDTACTEGMKVQFLLPLD